VRGGRKGIAFFEHFQVSPAHPSDVSSTKTKAFRIVKILASDKNQGILIYLFMVNCIKKTKSIFVIG